MEPVAEDTGNWRWPFPDNTRPEIAAKAQAI
jgi:hypothetical protein